MTPLIYANGFDQYADTTDFLNDPSWENNGGIVAGDVEITPGQWGGNALKFDIDAGVDGKSIGFRIPQQGPFRTTPQWYYFGCRLRIPSDFTAGTNVNNNSMPLFMLGTTDTAGQGLVLGITAANQIRLGQQRPASVSYTHLTLPTKA